MGPSLGLIGGVERRAEGADHVTQVGVLLPALASRAAITATPWSTVAWSRPPSKRPMRSQGKARSRVGKGQVSRVRMSHIATWRASASAATRQGEVSSAGISV